MPPVGKEEQPIGVRDVVIPVESEKTPRRYGVLWATVRFKARPRRKYKLWRNSGAIMICTRDVVGQKTSFEALKGGVVELRRNPDCAVEANKHRSQGKVLHVFRALCSDPGD